MLIWKSFYNLFLNINLVALDLGLDENDDFELTFGDLDGFFLPYEADDFLISEDLDQTTNSLDQTPMTTKLLEYP